MSLDVEATEIVGLLGPNGAGKSTTVGCIAGLHRPDHGRIRVFGLDPVARASAVRERVGVQLQEAALPDRLSPREAIELYAAFYRAPHDPGDLLERVDLAAQADTRFGQLSGGQRQRLSIALAIVGNPDFLVLDEPTAGLDPAGRRRTWRLVEDLRADGVGVLLVTHDMAEATHLCDRVGILHAGRIVALDAPERLVQRIGVRQRLHFRPSEPLDPVLLGQLDAIAEVVDDGGDVLVTGGADLLHAVSTFLVTNGTRAEELRLEQASLEDALLALTDQPAAAPAA